MHSNSNRRLLNTHVCTKSWPFTEHRQGATEGEVGDQQSPSQSTAQFQMKPALHTPAQSASQTPLYDQHTATHILCLRGFARFLQARHRTHRSSSSGFTLVQPSGKVGLYASKYTETPVSVCVCVCVCVCVRERERERENVCQCVRERESVCVSVCVCVCVWERERERERERLILFNYWCLYIFNFQCCENNPLCVFRVFVSLCSCVTILVYCLFYLLLCTVRQISL